MSNIESEEKRKRRMVELMEKELKKGSKTYDSNAGWKGSDALSSTVTDESNEAWGDLEWKTDRVGTVLLTEANSIQDSSANRLDRDLFDDMNNLKKRERDIVDEDYSGNTGSNNHPLSQNKYIV
jgi:hypothetical protein